jgi:hypothetical protein
LQPDKHPVEIANLTEVEKAVSVCVQQERSLSVSMVCGLHAMLMKGVPERPKSPIKPGRFRDVTDEMEAAGVEHLTKHMSPAWRVRSDVTTLLDEAEQDSLLSEGLHAAGRFHYRFVRIHPFCDGNGRMARALSTFLLAKEDPNILTFEKPLNRFILDYREDYVGVLEYCDSIYEDLKDTNIPEEDKLSWAGEPFSDFHARVFLKAYHVHNESEHRKLEEMGVLLSPFPSEPHGLYDLRLEKIMELHPWNETIKEAAVLSSRQ